jgi:hypothetical protein
MRTRFHGVARGRVYVTADWRVYVTAACGAAKRRGSPRPRGKDEEMSDYVVGFDLSDPAVKAAAEYLVKHKGAKYADTAQVENWPSADEDCTLYLVGHGDGTEFDDYKDPAEMFKEHDKLKAVYGKASTIVLVSCSTANEADLLLKGGGFQAATFAKNLKNHDTKKKVIAAVGPVYATDEGLFVQTPKGIEGVMSENGWREM